MVDRSLRFTKDQSTSVSWWDWTRQVGSRYDRCHLLTSYRLLESMNSHTHSVTRHPIRHMFHIKAPHGSSGTNSQFRLEDYVSLHRNEWYLLSRGAYIQETGKFVSSGLSWGMLGILVSPFAARPLIFCFVSFEWCSCMSWWFPYLSVSDNNV